MARGLIPSSPTTLTANCLLASFSKTPPKSFKLSSHSHLLHQHYHPQPASLPLACCFSVSSTPSQCLIDLSKYREAFSRRMAMAGLKPHHRIALGVSGGPDSMALCVLTAGWKTAGVNAVSTENGGFIDGLLAIIVDHGLRAESKEEANIVCHRVSEMGIRCEIASCDWPRGKPKQGQLQEAAREMRYQTFHDVCAQHQIGVLLIAHHADDQAELFILRLSRNSGVLGLAGMPFTSQIFPTHTHSYCEVPANQGILLVRPLLEFSKEDMYKICQGGSEDWVEDPTNRSPLFTRNRIRMELNNLSSSVFKSELQGVISACRITRAYVDQICYGLIRDAVVIKNHGYAVIDLQILCPLKIEDICLMKFLSLVLQFISQRQRQIRGSALKLLMDYIRTFPCKNSITAAGCYLCPDPGSRGSRVLVCCSVDCAFPLKMEFFETCLRKTNGQKEYCVASELEKIIEDEKSYANHLVPDASDVHFLNVKNPELVLTEAKRLNLISESTYSSILALQKQETNRFRSKTGAISDSAPNHEVEIATTFGKSLQPGQCCYVMDRFILTWKMNDNIDRDAISDLVDYDMDLRGEGRSSCGSSCVDKVLEVRHMVESDWLHLAELSKYPLSKNFPEYSVMSVNGNKQMTEKTDPYLHYASVSAKKALFLLRSIPVAARRSLPLLVNQQGQLLSIPEKIWSCGSRIIEDEKSYANHLVPDASDVHFLNVKNPELVLTEAKGLNIISESTYSSILALQKQETNRFRSKTGAISDSASNHEVEIAATFGKSLQPGRCCYVMDRFILTWKMNDNIDRDAISDLVDYDMDLRGEGWSFCCLSCVVGRDKFLEVRHMIESDWLYLAELSKYPLSKNFPEYGVMSVNGNKQMTEKTDPYLHYASVSAKKALFLLRSIPVAARRSLPVLINQQGQLLSIPSVNFRHCPCLNVHVEFKPKIPLGGGHSSFT